MFSNRSPAAERMMKPNKSIRLLIKSQIMYNQGKTADIQIVVSLKICYFEICLCENDVKNICTVLGLV